MDGRKGPADSRRAKGLARSAHGLTKGDTGPYETKVSRPKHSLKPTSYAQRLADVFEVFVDGAPRNSEDGADVGSAFTLLNPVEDLDLPHTEDSACALVSTRC